MILSILEESNISVRNTAFLSYCKFMKHFAALSLIFILLFFSPTVHAQQRPIRLESLSLDEGISYQTVYAIHQDSRGFLWIGTMSGLVRYDGYRNTVFRHDPSDPSTLSHDDIVSIYEDSRQKIWVGTYGGGLNRYDPETQLFERFVHDSTDSLSLSGNFVFTIAEDDQGKIWVGTQGMGLNIFDPLMPNLGFRRFPRSQSSPTVVHKILKSRDGNIWIGTHGRGLCEVQPGRQDFLYHPLISDKRDTIRYYKVFDIAEIGDELWLATNQGLRIWNQKEKWWSNRISHLPGKVTDSEIGRICMGQFGQVWIGTFGRGLLRVDTASWTVDQTKRNFADPFSLKSDVVTALFQDQSGLIWVGTAYGGLQKNTPDYYKFKSLVTTSTRSSYLSDENINALLADNNGIWVGNNGGLDFVGKDGSIEKLGPFLFGNSFPGVFAVSALWKDPDGSIWAGSIAKGLFHRQQGSWKNYRTSHTDTSALSSDMISAIRRDRSGHLWVGSMGGGLHQQDDKSGTFVRYNRKNSILPNNDILCITETSDSSIWVGTYGGLVCIPRYGAWKLYRHDAQNIVSLSDNYVFALFEDRNGKLWIGTNGGLCYLDPKTGQFHTFRQKDGLPSEVICGILEDDSGQLWISTQRGISRFDKERRVFRNYDKADGLLSNMFNRGALAKGADGKIYFGGIGGVNFFDPKRIQDNGFTPQVQITGFQKFDLPQVLSPDRKVNLAYDDNFFTISFSSMDFYAPGKNQYQFRLEPLEKAWRTAGSIHEASYTNLEPGTYYFRVRGSNRDGIWSPNEGTLKITIDPPFWKTKLFMFAVFAIVLLTGWVSYKISIRRKIQHALTLERVRTSERDSMREQISKDFHDELGHKLTKISLFSELSRRALKKDPEESSAFLEKVTEASSSLSVNTRDFIWVLDPGKDTLYDVIVNLRDFAYDLYEKTGVDFRLQGMTESLERVRLSMDWRRHLTLIFKEALTNALKHARAKQVDLIVYADNGKIVITLQDNGKGFDTRAMDLNRNGLRNIRERTKRLGGNISIESHKEKGTMVRFEGNLILTDPPPTPSRLSWISAVKSWFI